MLRFNSFHVTREREVASEAAGRRQSTKRQANAASVCLVGGESVDGAGFALHVVHKQILAQVVRRRKIGFTLAHLRNLLDELH